MYQNQKNILNMLINSSHWFIEKAFLYMMFLFFECQYLIFYYFDLLNEQTSKILSDILQENSIILDD